MERLGEYLAVIVATIIITLQLWQLIKLRDKFVKKENCVGSEHLQFITKEKFREMCRQCKQELSVEGIKVKDDIKAIMRALDNNDKKFTLIRLLQLEMMEKMGLEIPKSRIRDLEKIAKNSRTSFD